MLTDEDKTWLDSSYKGLSATDDGVSGTIEFSAAYDSRRNLFTILEEPPSAPVNGVALAGKFTVRIEEKKTDSFSALPAVYVDDLAISHDRHFCDDGIACLCSPLEENEFLTPTFRFQPFLERLVIPFLYGQQFYSTYQRWPWPEYAHGATGLLESYYRHPDPTQIEYLLHSLRRHQKVWPAIRSALRQADYVKGHTLCFCEKRDQMRRCHFQALQGLRQLYHDVRDHKIDF